ncbi:thermonuclease family protein [Bradyrhizobium sp. TM239]|uniref:thermonuclease family protein n=1 Tax=Bradyrhizobium sp. TM239 TaxID=2599802 RepID=UPI0027D5CD23|nr:hypothetical protein TM239_03010 [Bradyrhizobium sp. TM239]
MSRVLKLVLVICGLLAAGIARAEPISANAIHVVDGDTIDVGDQRYRMIGYDAPETGDVSWRGVSADEKALGQIARERLKELIRTGPLDLGEVPCSCPVQKLRDGTCNHGRKCAILNLNGRNVGETLIGEELAVRFRCGRTRCEKMPNWTRIIETQFPTTRKR